MATQVHDQPFQFQAEPKMVNQNSKIPNENNNVQVQVYDNVMIDSRIYRGNTHSLYFRKKYDPTYVDPKELVKPVKGKRINSKHSNETNENSMLLDEFKTMPLKRGSKHISQAVANGEKRNSKMPLTQDDSSNVSKNILVGKSQKSRKRNFIKTNGNRENKEIWVEENIRMQTDIIENLSNGVQTDQLPPKPIPKLEYKFSYGNDFSIQVIETDLFNFEIEVEPIINVLRSRIISESLTEVNYDEQISTLRNLHLQNQLINENRANELRQVKEKERERVVAEQSLIEIHRTKRKSDLLIHKKLVSKDYAKHLLDCLEAECDSTIFKLSGCINDRYADVRSKYSEFLYSNVMKNLEVFQSCEKLVQSMAGKANSQIIKCHLVN
jgi:hypothetical protein